jgi:sugar/nucleoside kinase (ribokinase family)
MTEHSAHRSGIASGGNWIVDRVKTVDRIPGHSMLGNILIEQRCPGGAPANVLGDLARMQSPFPLTGLGVVGNDESGEYLLDTFANLGVDVTMIRRTRQAPTSYTDVVQESESGARCFYHHRGANAFFTPDAIPIPKLTCRIFHLGYILLLDGMDQEDKDYGTVAARVLHDLQASGIRTSVDVVSEESARFRVFVPPALRHVDYLILNEVETARTVGRTVRDSRGKLDGPALIDAADALYSFGPMEWIAIHMPEGVYVRDRAGNQFSRGSLALPKGFIAGTVGAGDAFCAGMLYGIHEQWSLEDSAHLGTCCAAASLSAPGASDGVGPLSDVLALGKRYPEQAPPIRI